ncbi:MAG: hypothetical protein H5U40_18600, partial [Polyangiaceae bacterium]|nr:hypothetical protein [Polyangiaceae bacterium]
QARAEPRAPLDVPAAWHAGARPLELAELPADFVRSQRGPVTYVHPHSEAARIDELDATFERNWSRITTELGREVDASMTIALARDLDELRLIAPPRHPPPRYAIGVAYPASGIVLLSLKGHGLGSAPDLSTVLVHELSHVALQRAVGGTSVPRWFSEGLAIQQAGEQSLARLQALFKAYVEGRAHPLDELDGAFSGRAFEVNVAYAQSADLVSYLSRGDTGPRKLRHLVSGLRRGEPFEHALEQSHYVNLDALEREWLADLRERYGSLPMIVGGSAVWSLASVLLVLAWRKRRLEKRRNLRRMEQEEVAIERLEALVELKLEEGPAPNDDDSAAEASLSELPLHSDEDDLPTV